MPFMLGRGAVRRTVQYLEKGQILLRDSIKILAFNVNDNAEIYPHHQGLHNFVFWHLPQLKYKNPDVQMVTFKYMTPTPWIKAYLEDDREVLIDCDSRERQEIHDHMKLVLGKPARQVASESREEAAQQNIANFGWHFQRQCMCEVPGQVPCPGYTALPKEMTGKWRVQQRRGDD